MITSPVLLEIWREVCRHIRMEESLDSIARMLASTLPLRGLSVVGFDPASRTLVARGGSYVPPARLLGRTGAQPGPGEIEEIQRWLDLGEPLVHRRSSPPQ